MKGGSVRGSEPRRRRIAGLAVAASLAGGVLAGCEDGVEPPPPKSANRPPETFLFVQGDTLLPQFYKVQLRWLGSDPDGAVSGYRHRWTCLDLGAGRDCPGTPEPWIDSPALADSFVRPVPGDSAAYLFEVAAVDEEGTADPTPAAQVFRFYNHAPVATFEPNTLPAQSLPAVTFYLRATDPDGAHLASYRAWLDGQPPDSAKVVPYSQGLVTFRPEDFGIAYGTRTVFVQAVDDGGAASPAIQHTWQVVAPPAQGVLLVDDCRGTFSATSDVSYRNVLRSFAPGRHVVLDLRTVPRLSSGDLDATLSLFERVVWYTDADTRSSGALKLARQGLDSLLARGGSLFLSSGLAFGTGGDFADQESRFRQLFGIDRVFAGPDSTTNFFLSNEDTLRAAVHPGLVSMRFSYGTPEGRISECFAARRDPSTRSLYFYPESSFVRDYIVNREPVRFVNPEQFDVGVYHQQPGGGRVVYLSFPAGLPINDNMGENETEIRELLRLAGIVEP